MHPLASEKRTDNGARPNPVLSSVECLIKPVTRNPQHCLAIFLAGPLAKTALGLALWGIVASMAISFGAICCLTRRLAHGCLSNCLTSCLTSCLKRLAGFLTSVRRQSLKSPLKAAFVLAVVVPAWMVQPADAEQPRARTVRNLYHAGIAYPKSPGLRGYLAKALGGPAQGDEIRWSEKSVVAVAPSGAYRHCGPSLQALFEQLLPYRFDHVVLIGGRHKPLKGISVYWAGPGSLWKNPLDPKSTVAIDPIGSTLARQFHKAGAKPEEDHWGEQSLELLVPFVVWSYPGQSFSAILINDLDQVDLLVRGLKETFRGKRVLYLVSASFSQGLVPDLAEKQDVRTMALMRGKGPALLSALRSTAQMTDSPAAVYTAHRLQNDLGLAPFFWTDYRQSTPIHGAAVKKESVTGRGYLSGWTRPAHEKLSSRMGQALMTVARHALAKALGHSIPPKDPAIKEIGRWPTNYGIGLKVGGRQGPGYEGLFLSGGGAITNLPKALSAFIQAFVRLHRDLLTAVHPGQMRVDLFVVPQKPRLLVKEGLVPYQDSAAVVRKGQVIAFERGYWKEERQRLAYLDHLARKVERSDHPLVTQSLATQGSAQKKAGQSFALNTASQGSEGGVLASSGALEKAVVENNTGGQAKDSGAKISESLSKPQVNRDCKSQNKKGKDGVKSSTACKPGSNLMSFLPSLLPGDQIWLFQGESVQDADRLFPG
jgi:AmmeMemoRadiSam system protein B